ncbi:hypothetical protein ESZ36_01560 [Colwellia demingiae]|uniref:Uncharacterized protein n=1 Tax=Colwellia demingiae TaxID=89401 RepID=A0A5C6QSL6_9GAMM|nr:hypothetical protein [Colwellia demingiae]TWX71944.1 hypothetical protein ESZ36_01560 [Colwellia demingiae]
MTNIGFGDSNFNFAVYIANKPNMLEYQSLGEVTTLVEGEINVINQACGNGWRKVFNVYAKLLYCLDKKSYNFSTYAPTWQNYRDKYLLQAQSKTALLFSVPQLVTNKVPNKKTNKVTNNKHAADKEIVHIICGKGHAKALISSGKLVANLIWLDDEFAIDSENKLIVCPYFDYRQLSNIKIERLAGLLQKLKSV